MSEKNDGNVVNISGSNISGGVAGGNLHISGDSSRRHQDDSLGPQVMDSFRDYLPRLLVSVDVVNYSARDTLQKRQVTGIVSRGVSDIFDWVNLKPQAVYVQGTGDGFNMIFPVDTRLDRVVPKIIQGWRSSLIMSNQTAGVPVRTRVVMGVGASSVSNNAIDGEQIVHQTRVLNSAELKAFTASRESLLTLAVDRFIHENLVQGDLLAGIPWDEGFQWNECAGRDAWLTSC